MMIIKISNICDLSSVAVCEFKRINAIQKRHTNDPIGLATKTIYLNR